MKKKDWSKMIRGGESLTVEFQAKVPKLSRLSRSFSAFSNSSGGYVFFGIQDDGKIIGLDSPEGTRNLAEQVSQFHCDPPAPMTCHLWEPLPRIKVLVAEIPEAQLKPVHAVSPNNRKDSWPFFRSDKENLPLDKKSIKTMRRKESIEIEDDLDVLDRHSIRILNHLHDNPGQTLNMLGRCANISPHRAKKILVHLEKNGWIHSFFNEKRREFSLVIPWKKR